jgi:hypothetical protein
MLGKLCASGWKRARYAADISAANTGWAEPDLAGRWVSTSGHPGVTAVVGTMRDGGLYVEF